MKKRKRGDKVLRKVVSILIFDEIMCQIPDIKIDAQRLGTYILAGHLSRIGENLTLFRVKMISHVRGQLVNQNVTG